MTMELIEMFMDHHHKRPRNKFLSKLDDEEKSLEKAINHYNVCKQNKGACDLVASIIFNDISYLNLNIAFQFAKLMDFSFPKYFNAQINDVDLYRLFKERDYCNVSFYIDFDKSYKIYGSHENVLWIIENVHPEYKCHLMSSLY